MTIQRIFQRASTALLRMLIGSPAIAPPFATTVGSILVIRQHNQLGDMLCVVPLLHALRLKYPDARITLLTSPVNRDVMLHNQYLSEVIDFDKRQFLANGRFHGLQFLKFLRDLRDRHFDLALVPATVSVSGTSDFLAWASGAKLRLGAGELEGKHNPTGFFYNLPLSLNWKDEPHRHQTLRNLDIGEPLDLELPVLESEITFTAEEKKAGREFLGETFPGKKLVIAFHPGAGKVANRWPAERFAEVANTLASEVGAGVLVTLGPMDKEPGEIIENQLCCVHYVLKNQSIRRIASILSHVNLVVSNDTGIMHVAAATGVPVLSLFGPTDPSQWAPLGTRHRYIRGEGGNICSIPVAEVLRVIRMMIP